MIVSIREVSGHNENGDQGATAATKSLLAEKKYLVHFSDSSDTVEQVQEQDGLPSSIFRWSRFSQMWVDLFLPLGYPHSVHPSYLPYQIWDGVQGLCSYWRGVVATQAVLEASGVGNVEATAAGAAIQWALRDGTGMVGGLVFSYVASQYLDTHVKEFRLFADIINDVALTLDMLAPYARRHGSILSWSILSLSTIGKTLCGVSAGATKGRITQHFSRQGNMADLSAKESTQETLVSLLGMIGGVAVARILHRVPYILTWVLFGVLTVIHVLANYKAVKLLKLKTLNPERTCELMEEILRTLVNNRRDQDLVKAIQHLKTPEEMDECLCASTRKLLFPTTYVNTAISPEHFRHAKAFETRKYIIGTISPSDGRLVVHLRVNATLYDEFCAFCHALLVEKIVLGSQNGHIDRSTIMDSFQKLDRIFGSCQHRISGGTTVSLWEVLKSRGWDTQERLYLGFGPGRVDFSVTEGGKKWK